MGGKSGGGDSQTQVTDLPPWQKPFVKRAFNEASDLFRNNDLEFFPGSTVAERQPEELTAKRGFLDYAQGGAEQGSQALLDALQFQSTGAIDVENNPALQRAIEAAQRPTRENLLENVLPAISGGAQQAGQVGGSRQGIAEGLAISRADQTSADIASRMASDAYAQGLDAQTKSLALGPSILQAGAFPETMMARIGEAERTYEQALIDEAIQRFNFEQQAPYTELQQYMNIVGQPMGGQTTATNTGGPSDTQTAVAGGLSGAAAGAYIGSVVPGIGTAIGAGVGGLIGLLGSQA